MQTRDGGANLLLRAPRELTRGRGVASAADGTTAWGMVSTLELSFSAANVMNGRRALA